MTVISATFDDKENFKDNDGVFDNQVQRHCLSMWTSALHECW